MNYADELTDFGVSPQNFLQSNVGSPTPRSIPGGRVVTTDQLRAALAGNRRRFLLIDALGGDHESIPESYHIPEAGYSGNFNDSTQSYVFSTLRSLTGGDVAYPLVFFCRGSQCWESYNAALRAMRMGFSNVYWYRGGINAWQEAGLPMSWPTQ